MESIVFKKGDLVTVSESDHFRFDILHSFFVENPEFKYLEHMSSVFAMPLVSCPFKFIGTGIVYNNSFLSYATIKVKIIVLTQDGGVFFIQYHDSIEDYLDYYIGSDWRSQYKGTLINKRSNFITERS